MPYQSDQSNDDLSQKLPPAGDQQKAEKYLNQLIEFIRQDKLPVNHTDLKKFDPSSLQDHYQLELGDYQIEVSHSKQAETGKDFYTILFNNLKQIREGCSEKIILAYLNLTQDQFQKFSAAADTQIEKRRKEAEEKRFNEAMTPIDRAFKSLLSPNEGPNYRKEDRDNREERAHEAPRENHHQTPHESYHQKQSQPDVTAEQTREPQQPKEEVKEGKEYYQRPNPEPNQTFTQNYHSANESQPNYQTNNYPPYPTNPDI